MVTPAERVFLIIADISGYTHYLAGSEIEHAQDILADLLETVVRAMGPVLRLAKLEGDAVFSYAPEAAIDASMLLDTLETCYSTFRRRIQSIHRATTCQCNACRTIPNLNLKFCAHHGAVVRHRVAGHEELAGTDVILVHRLLKNAIAERFGLHGYALLTSACVEALRINPEALGMTAHVETYEHLGEVRMLVQDLEAHWTREQEIRRVFVQSEGADVSIPFTFPAPPALVWEYLISPTKRPLWLKGVTRLEPDSGDGRIGVGSTLHCVHGQFAHPEEILDWRPFHYFTWATTLPELGEMTTTVELTAVPEGTALRNNVRLKTPPPKAVGEHVVQDFLESFAKLAGMLKDELVAREEPEGVQQARAELVEAAARAREKREGSVR